jgi:hypothetical protein
MANRPRRFLLYSFAALVPAIGLLAGTAAAASARTITVHTATTHSAAAEARAIAVAEIKKLTVGYHPTDRHVGVISPGKQGLSDVESTNWSGYADTGSSFSDVSQGRAAARVLSRSPRSGSASTGTARTPSSRTAR